MSDMASGDNAKQPEKDMKRDVWNKEGKGENASSQSGITDLSKFVLKRVISRNKVRKTICLEGSFSDAEGIALLFLEKAAMNLSTVKKLFSKEVVLYKNSEDDSTYEYIPEADMNEINLTLIFPATERHIKKYELFPIHIIEETPELYNDVTLPCITESSFSLQWVYNILAYQAEKESIVFDDCDPVNGFVFLPDLKWNQKQIESLYMMAIVRPVGIKSLRDLNSDHLPLLRNIKTKGLAVIKEKYNLADSQIRIYVHYLPSYYHFHVHFTNIDYAAPGITTTRAHLLETVISNIETIPDYYRRSTLSFTVKETDKLFLRYKEKGLVKEVPSTEVTLEGKSVEKCVKEVVGEV